MPTFTTNFNYNLPLVNNATDADLWGGQLNSNWSDIDGDISYDTSTQSFDFNVLSTDFNKTFLIDASSSNVTATLPTAASVFDGFVVRFKGIDVTNVATIDGNGSETIDGNASVTLDSQNAVLECVCDGSNWVLTTTTAAESSTTVSGTVRKATQAEVESETLDTNVTSDNAQFHPGVAKAWVNFTGTGTVAIQGSHNVSSITDNGPGDYTINLSITMANTNYAALGMTYRPALSTIQSSTIAGIAQTTTTFTVATTPGDQNSHLRGDVPNVFFSIFGDV